MAGRPRKSQIDVTSRLDAAKTRNTALARRLQGNPFISGSKDIPLKEPKRWHTHIASMESDESRFYKMRQNGWEPVTVDDIDGPIEESGFRLHEDGKSLVRGVKGREMAFKMLKEDYRLLEAAKEAASMKGIGSARKIKADIAEAAGRQLGDEAGSYLSNLDGQVIDRITGGDAA